MTLKEIIDDQIRQAEQFGAFESSVTVDYNSDWELTIAVKNKKKK